jgi:hypothetical protein
MSVKSSNFPIRQFPDFRRRRRNVKPSVIGGSGVKLNG